MLALRFLRRTFGPAVQWARQHSTDSSSDVRTVTLIKGDGIGPEISEAVMDIFKAAQVELLSLFLYSHPGGVGDNRYQSHGTVSVLHQSGHQMDTSPSPRRSSIPCTRTKLD